MKWSYILREALTWLFFPLIIVIVLIMLLFWRVFMHTYLWNIFDEKDYNDLTINKCTEKIRKK